MGGVGMMFSSQICIRATSKQEFTPTCGAPTDCRNSITTFGIAYYSRVHFGYHLVSH